MHSDCWCEISLHSNYTALVSAFKEQTNHVTLITLLGFCLFTQRCTSH